MKFVFGFLFTLLVSANAWPQDGEPELDQNEQNIVHDIQESEPVYEDLTPEDEEVIDEIHESGMDFPVEDLKTHEMEHKTDQDLHDIMADIAADWNELVDQYHDDVKPELKKAWKKFRNAMGEVTEKEKSRVNKILEQRRKMYKPAQPIH